MKRFAAGVILVFMVFGEVLSSSVAVLRAILGRRLPQSATIPIPLTLTSDLGITLFAHCISLTPGTLSMQLSADRSHLLVHALDGSQPAQLVRHLKGGMERRLLQLIEGREL